MRVLDSATVRMTHLTVRADRPAEELVAELEALLDERLRRAGTAGRPPPLR